MADIAGHITVSLDWNEGRISTLSLSSSRPAQMGRLFHGRTVVEVARMIPLLFTACSVAQRLAFTEAVENCRDVVVASEVSRGRQLLLQVENCRELLFRLLRDWVAADPGQLLILQQIQGILSRLLNRWDYLLQPLKRGGLNGDQVRQLSTLLEQERKQIADQLTGMLTPLLGMPVASFQRWLDRVSPEHGFNAPLLEPIMHLHHDFSAVTLGPDLQPLPDLQQRQQQQILEAAAEVQQTLFCATPRWQGECCETGSYSNYRYELQHFRLQGWHELSCRYAAMLIQLSQVPGLINADDSAEITESAGGNANSNADGIGPGIGMGIVATSRGQLLHRVEMMRERILSYHILAPTEWNLHPRGLVATKLQGVRIETDSQALSLGRTMLLLADPCVAFDITLNRWESV
ncbi:nickel-dependent hydrogenase large subunit [Amphritea pacifica]|uniref:Nickel-dependent hydrogenase large subunit n=1 Tax=Amphritea pacifica TaxID=2811233 RepID=A0ABS2W2S7_9GAMM|nr:nickel-dependent hydrogenase large subunit [Amphritea pacifica]MBN0986014.1 nickel-dependent hydrogenase large subunit [Amphritea pacifica]